VKSGATLDDVLGVRLKNILERRLQTMICRKGLARTMTQARQFIVHEHITVGGKKITAPSHLVTVQEEPTISFVSNSTLASAEHPERIVQKKPTAELARAARAA
jgi:small subunit ribosomal protein S4